MAKEEAEKEKKQKKEKKDKKDDKEKKDKKRKRSETEDGHKSKKEKRDKGGEQDGEQDGDVTMTLLDSLEDKASPPTVSQVNGDVIARSHRPVGALLPFANPLADEKVQKKVLKSVKKGKGMITVLLGRWHYQVPALTALLPSREEPVYQTWREGSGQGGPQIPDHWTRRYTSWDRHSRRRHIANGCHLPYTCSL